MKKNIIYIVVILVVVAVGVCGYIFLSQEKIDQPKDVLKEVNAALINKTEMVMFVYDTGDKVCEKCAEIRKTLKDKKVKYYTFDKKLATKSEYSDLMKKLKINEKDFSYPALIYIRDGIMYANIINVNDVKNVKTFIKDYKLNEIK